eukprot:g17029.t1
MTMSMTESLIDPVHPQPESPSPTSDASSSTSTLCSSSIMSTTTAQRTPERYSYHVHDYGKLLHRICSDVGFGEWDQKRVLLKPLELYHPLLKWRALRRKTITTTGVIDEEDKEQDDRESPSRRPYSSAHLPGPEIASLFKNDANEKMKAPGLLGPLHAPEIAYAHEIEAAAVEQGAGAPWLVVELGFELSDAALLELDQAERHAATNGQCKKRKIEMNHVASADGRAEAAQVAAVAGAAAGSRADAEPSTVVENGNSDMLSSLRAKYACTATLRKLGQEIDRLVNHAGGSATLPSPTTSEKAPFSAEHDQDHEQAPDLCVVIRSVTRRPVFVKGRYNKYSRKVSQTQWFLNDELADVDEVEDEAVHEDAGREAVEGDHEVPATAAAASRKAKTSAVQSVEELVVDTIGDKFYFADSGSGRLLPEMTSSSKARTNIKFHAAGREDIDVRMLGNGRPFVLEIADANRRPNILSSGATTGAEPALAEAIASGSRASDEECARDGAARTDLNPEYDIFGSLAQDEDVKIGDGDIEVEQPSSTERIATVNLNTRGQFPLTLQQKTPFRVLHRRAQACWHMDDMCDSSIDVVQRIKKRDHKE